MSRPDSFRQTGAAPQSYGGSIPTFTVVGHPNKGKSSIVATLAEDERIAISPVPGTTRNADRFTFTIDGEPYYQLVDTPGFQRAKALLEWCRERETSSSDRPAIVREFVESHREDERFHDECALLEPILGGAGILYVVDGSKPYGPEFDIEMEILRWTGQPRMALINLIGDQDHIGEWRQALGQYFSIVRTFDAMQADFDARLNLLRAFCELDESWRTPLERAINAMGRERRHRLQQSAREIADELIDCLRLAVSKRLTEGTASSELTSSLTADLLRQLERREQEARDAIQAIYRHERLTRSESPLPILDTALFARESWELFGLSKTQLLLTGTVSGAVAGLGIDAIVGGTSLLLGTGVGALIGAATTWFGSSEIAKVELLGDTLGGRVLKAGPIADPNFPWVLLGRAWAHHALVRERNHALREAISVELTNEQNLTNKLPDALRRDLAKAFARIDDASADRDQLARLVADALGAVVNANDSLR